MNNLNTIWYIIIFETLRIVPFSVDMNVPEHGLYSGAQDWPWWTFGITGPSWTCFPDVLDGFAAKECPWLKHKNQINVIRILSYPKGTLTCSGNGCAAFASLKHSENHGTEGSMMGGLPLKIRGLGQGIPAGMRTGEISWLSDIPLGCT